MSTSAYEKLRDAHSSIYAAAAVISAYGRPRGTRDPFDKAVLKAIEQLNELVESLPALLGDARCEELLERISVLKGIAAAGNVREA
jgi:hypothetical protein